MPHGYGETMSVIDDWRERRNRRRDRLRRIIFGNTPRPSRLERALLVFTVVATAYISYHFRLVHAQTFGVMGFGFVVAYFAVRRLWWSRKTAQRVGGPS